MQTQELMPEASEEWLGAMLTFSCHSSHFAIPVESVHYISHDAKTSCTVHGGVKESQPFIEFDGQPIPIYSFSRIIGQKSNTEYYGQLIASFDQRRKDYQDWMTSLENNLQNNRFVQKSDTIRDQDFLNVKQGSSEEDEKLVEILELIEEPQKKVNALMDNLMEIALSDGKEKALEYLRTEKESTLNDILMLLSSATERVKALIRPIAVILESDKNLFALELDEISDIVEFSHEDRLDERFSARHKIDDYPIASGLLKQKDSPLYLILTPSKILDYVHSEEFLSN